MTVDPSPAALAASAGVEPRPTAAFPALYESKRSRHLPETPAWLDARTLPAPTPGWAGWTEVLIDFRLPHHRDPLPPVLPETGRVIWESRAPGWALEGWAFWLHPATGTPIPGPDTGDTDGPDTGVAEEMPLPDAVSVLRFTDPTGFRFALVVSADHPGATPVLATGRLSFLLPAFMALLTTWAPTADHPGAPLELPNPDTDPDGPGHGHDRGYDLEALRDAVADPTGWFTNTNLTVHDDLPDLLPGTTRHLPAARALLAWAPTGATRHTQVAHWCTAGLDPTETRNWMTLNDPARTPNNADPHTGTLHTTWTGADITAWYTAIGGGAKRRRAALTARKTGLTPTQAAHWGPLLHWDLGRPHYAALIRGCDTAGWTPDQALAIARRITLTHQTRARATGATPFGHDALAEVVDWLFTTPALASLFLRAGITPSEAATLVAHPDGIGTAALETLAALQPPAPTF